MSFRMLMPATTMVVTMDGNKPISECVHGDLVAVQTYEGVSIFAPISVHATTRVCSLVNIYLLSKQSIMLTDWSLVVLDDGSPTFVAGLRAKDILKSWTDGVLEVVVDTADCVDNVSLVQASFTDDRVRAIAVVGERESIDADGILLMGEVT